MGFDPRLRPMTSAQASSKRNSRTKHASSKRQNQQDGSNSAASGSPQVSTLARTRSPQEEQLDADLLDTPRARLAAAVFEPKKSKRKRRAPDPEDVEDVQLLAEQQAGYRRLDRAMRWNAFLHFTNDLFAVEARSKIFDNTKSWKWRVLKKMEEFVEIVLLSEEHRLVRMYKTRSLLSQFFTTLFNTKNFFDVFYYMDGYVSFERSSELGQYYMRCKYHSYDCSTATDRVCSSERDRLLRFYDSLPSHDSFKQVNKEQFYEVRSRYRNDKKKVKARDDGILREDFVSLGPRPNPKAVAGAGDELEEDDPETSELLEE
ncbi:hypothetical protein V8E54_006869 [Elaphomyces granulatus]